MEVKVVSVVNVKPSCLSATNDDHHHHQLKPFKLCLLDQLMPRSYFGVILFYLPNSNINIASKLKASLSTALSTTFYPLAGREKGNATVDDFQAGVPFIAATVEGYAAVSEFLQRPDLEHLNKLFPMEPFCLLTLSHDGPPPPSLLVQVNTFDCGGVAVGLSFYHKLADAATADAFLKTWVAAAARGQENQDDDGDSMINLSQAGASVFPPREPIFPSEVERLGDKMFHDKGRRTVTRRFVFDAGSVATLKSRIAATATGGNMENPTTTEAISAFLWESSMRAAADVLLEPPRFVMQSVNLRPRIKSKDVDQRPLLSDNSIGNLFTSTMASCDDSHVKTSTTIGDLAELIRAGIARVDGEFVKTASGDDGFEVMVEGMKGLGELKQRGEALHFSSWIGFGFADVDFGWGRPAWTGVFGDASGDYPLVGNLIVLMKGLDDLHRDDRKKNIEAWIRLDENVMAVLDKDHHFLEFASLNPSVLL